MNRKHPQIDASQMELFGFSAPAESNGTATAILEAPLQIEETRALIETLVDEVDEDAPKTNIPDEAWRRRNLALNVDDPVNLTPLERLRTNLLAITRIKDHQSGNSLTNKQRRAGVALPTNFSIPATTKTSRPLPHSKKLSANQGSTLCEPALKMPTTPHMTSSNSAGIS
jgi:hypothetical protein